jgi:hypothetical protein
MILITGEGRSGTTLMVEIFGLLGFDYGGHFEFLREVEVGPNTKFPEVIKHGGFSENLKKWIDEYQWKVDYMLYLANDMETCVAKRLYPNKEVAATSPWQNPPTISPKTLGLTTKEFQSWSESEKEKAVRELYWRRLGHAAYNAIECGVPFSIVHYQRFCRDIGYACSIMEPLLPLNKFTIEQFRKVHGRHIDLKQVRPWGRHG